MTLSEMRTLVRRDLMDEGSPQRFSDDELDRAISRAVTEMSKYSPCQQKSTLATVSASYDVDISSLADRISVDRVEFPVDQSPRVFIRFSLYQDTLTLETQGDGNNCHVYWTTQHTIDASTATIPAHLYDLVALGASAYAALSFSQYATDKANLGGENVDRDYLYWARGRMLDFEKGLRKLKSKLRLQQLYTDE